MRICRTQINRRVRVECIEQLPEGQLWLADQNIVKRREGLHGRYGHGGHVGAHGNGDRPPRPRQKDTVHVILECGGGDLREVEAWSQPIQLCLKALPRHAPWDGVDDADGLVREERSQLREVGLRPDHALSGSASDPMLAANPDRTIGCRRIHQEQIDAFLILLRLVLQGECIRSWRRLGNNPLLQTRAPVALRLITHGKHDRSASISLRRELNSSSTRMISQKMSRLRPSMERTVPPSR